MFVNYSVELCDESEQKLRALSAKSVRSDALCQWYVSTFVCLFLLMSLGDIQISINTYYRSLLCGFRRRRQLNET